MPKVRITAFPARWLTERDSFSNSTRIEWSTGETTQPGDIQIFAVSATLGDNRDLATDPRRDAVHSIWEAETPPLKEYLKQNEWPIQAAFKLLVKLDHPVPKEELIGAGLLKQSWPQGSRGKLLKTDNEIRTLAEVLAKKNPRNRPAIFKALGLRFTSVSGGRGASILTKKHVKERNGADATAETTFIEGEKRAARTTARSPGLRASAKKRWGLKCYCCEFDFEQYYGTVAKGMAIVHHLQLFADTNGKQRAVTVEDVRVVCANCHYVIHVQNPPIDIDDLKQSILLEWTSWSEKGVSRRSRGLR
jgi:hypothetical protein